MLGHRRGVAGLWWMAWHALSAPSFAGFWTRWNPWTSYALRRWCYAPLRALGLPRPAATLVTFAISGFVFHDLPFWWGPRWLLAGERWPPFATAWFTVMAVAALTSRALGQDLTAFVPWQRALAHVGLMLGCAVPAFAFAAWWGAPPGW